MFSSKKSVPILVAVALLFMLIGDAEAADESVTATTSVSPRHGRFFKEVGVASNLKIRAEIEAPATSPLVNPMKRAKLTFPAGLTLVPHNRKTPVCTDARLSVRSNLANPAGVVGSCARSVVGTGTAAIVLAKINNNPNAVIEDPFLVIFNAGRTHIGQPRMKIYGYSKTTNVGILMSGVLRGRVLEVAVPVLSSDSAVKYFEFNLPGPSLVRSDVKINVRGLDPNYVRVKCARSPLRTKAIFWLGERAYPGGQVTGPTTTVSSPETTQKCFGAAGRARLRAVRVNGPKAARRGRKVTFRVTVRNNGTASARNVVVRSNRGGKARIRKLAPGKRKTARVRARIRGRKNHSTVVRFVARSGNLRATIFKRIRVR